MKYCSNLITLKIILRQKAHYTLGNVAQYKLAIIINFGYYQSRLHARTISGSMH